ncbi:MAG TPA: hypothetical protein VI653_11290, partial [Steroidobacteraceae bacterium]
LRETVKVAHSQRGVIASMTAAIADPDSALHASCVTMRASGAELLARAQAAGLARKDIDGADLFALVGALAWLNDQPAHASRTEHLFEVIVSAILTNRPSAEVREDGRASRRAAPTRPALRDKKSKPRQA